MSWYEQHILPSLLDFACGMKAIRKQREKIVPQAAGDVLEIGIGTGLNLPYYDTAKVGRIWGLEPVQGMRDRARRRAEFGRLDVEFIDLPGEEIPLDDASVDTVLVTYTLCTIPDTVAALAGMRRVLKPGGRMLFCEHGIAPDESIKRWQNRLNPAWKKLAGGCNMNRDMPEIISNSGFTIERDERMYVPGPKILAYNYWGSAKVR